MGMPKWNFIMVSPITAYCFFKSYSIISMHCLVIIKNADFFLSYNLELTNVDSSSLLMDEGDGSFKGSTYYSSISIKHNNGELTIFDIIVVQAMSCKVVSTDPNIMQLHCPTSLVMSKRWEHAYHTHIKIYVCNV